MLRDASGRQCHRAILTRCSWSLFGRVGRFFQRGFVGGPDVVYCLTCIIFIYMEIFRGIRLVRV